MTQRDECSVWEPAKMCCADLGFEDHGYFMLLAEFDFGGAVQGLGYNVDLAFIKAFIRACGAERLSECTNKIVMVLHDHSGIHGIKPMPFDQGEPFDVDAWVRGPQQAVRQ